ncbi:MAG: GerAB/ArcD/ProY family transporter [Bacilli bacterium]|nr:GerAB/ArcD/ProY family transporter [Bacilli bacterium]
MDNVKMRHVLSLGILYSLGTSLIYIGSRGYHAWQASICAFILCIPLYFVYLKLLKKYPGKNFFEVISNAFGKLIGTVLIVLYIIFLWYKAGRIVFAYNDLVITTNKLAFRYKEFLLLLNLILMGYILKSGLNSITRFAQVSFVIVTILTIALFIVGLGNMEILNIFPIYPINTNDFFYNLLVYFVQPFVEITVFYNVICKITEYRVQKKVFILMPFISLVFIVIIIIQTICILGEDYTLILNYPYYSCISAINVMKLVVRLETISIITFYICSSIKLAVLVYSMELGVSELFNRKSNDKKYYYGLLFMSTALSFLLYNNVGELKNMTVYYCMVAFIMMVIYPFLILIFGKK